MIISFEAKDGGRIVSKIQAKNLYNMINKHKKVLILVGKKQ